jgi:hypothetical protein
MIKHPKDRLERRSIYAKELELKQYHQRKINGKKRKIKVELAEKETGDELRKEVDHLEGFGGTID